MKIVSTINMKGSNMLVVRVLFICLIILSNTSFANSGNENPTKPNDVLLQNKNSPALSLLNESYKQRITELKSENELLIKKLGDLESSLDALADKNAEHSNKLSFAEWSGILLACVAVIVTVLGVVVALFSFVGYKKVLDSAKDTANEVANEQVAAKIHDSTRAELQALFSNKALFDKNSAEYKNLAPVRKFLLEAVAKVIYRDIQFDTSDHESDTGNEE